MICYEMIGYFSDEPNSQTYPSADLAAIYPSTADFIAVVGIQEHSEFNHQIYRFMKQNDNLKTEVVYFPSRDGLAGMSDQRNYWEFGYQALMINDSSFIRNPHYHQSTDTIETLDFDKMTEVINLAYIAITEYEIQ